MKACLCEARVPAHPVGRRGVHWHRPQLQSHGLTVLLLRVLQQEQRPVGVAILVPRLILGPSASSRAPLTHGASQQPQARWAP